MGAADGELVNWERVGELEAEIGAGDFAEVVEIFLEECDGTAARLADGEPGALEADLHFLRGAAMNLGLDAMAAACQAGERAAAQGEGARVDRAAIAELYGASRAALLEGTARRGAA